MKLDRHLTAALLDIDQYPDEAFFWRAGSMPKLAALGLVEPHPNTARAWRITAKGREAAASLRVFGSVA